MDSFDFLQVEDLVALAAEEELIRQMLQEDEDTND